MPVALIEGAEEHPIEAPRNLRVVLKTGLRKRHIEAHSPRPRREARLNGSRKQRCCWSGTIPAAASCVTLGLPVPSAHSATGELPVLKSALSAALALTFQAQLTTAARRPLKVFTDAARALLWVGEEVPGEPPADGR